MVLSPNIFKQIRIRIISFIRRVPQGTLDCQPDYLYRVDVRTSEGICFGETMDDAQRIEIFTLRESYAFWQSEIILVPGKIHTIIRVTKSSFFVSQMFKINTSWSLFQYSFFLVPLGSLFQTAIAFHIFPFPVFIFSKFVLINPYNHSHATYSLILIQNYDHTYLSEHIIPVTCRYIDQFIIFHIIFPHELRTPFAQNL